MSGPRSRQARTVTLADVAEEAGVSRATASFVLSGRDGRASAGSERTRRKVREAADRLEYVPNRHARAMRTGKADAIVLALGTVGDPWGVSLARAVRELALPQSLATVVLADERWFEFLSGYASDCAFVTGADESLETLEQVRRLARAGVEIVAFSEHLEPEGFDVVSSSPARAVEEAYTLLSARHEIVSFYSSVPLDAGERRLNPPRGVTFIDAARAVGDEASARSVKVAGRGSGTSLSSALAWLEGTDRPSAVVCSTGFLALAMQAAAVRCGIRVPEDLEIISIGDVPREAQFLDPISYYGVEDVFARIARIIVDRATRPTGEPGRRHDFTWRLFPGSTTREAPRDGASALR